MTTGETTLTPDSQLGGLVGWLPKAAQPYALLARFDRPIGWWLLFWPGAWAISLAGGAISHWTLYLWLLLGAVAMRGAGCVLNDIVDADLDRQVERTRSRPVASGAVSARAAWIWLGFLCLIGLVVLLQLPRIAQIIALASILPVAAYPVMKRITWWPQAWLGIVFSWAAPVAWAAVLPDALMQGVMWQPILALYLGCIFWVIGYDTIYAIQDIEDDTLVGIKSSARAMGSHLRGGVTLCYALALIGWGSAFWLVRPDPLVFAALIPVAVHLIWQVTTLDPENGENGLARFRSNRFLGFLMLLACLTVGMSA